MTKVYIASKFHHGQRWKDLSEEAYKYDHPWYGITFVGRWFLDYAGVIPDEPQFCKLGWEHDIEDVIACDVLIVYAEPEEHLRGALVEVGAALAYGRYVLTIGDHPDYGTWKHHANVHQMKDLDSALTWLRCHDFPRTVE
jgi:hypothetical protein